MTIYKKKAFEEKKYKEASSYLHQLLKLCPASNEFMLEYTKAQIFSKEFQYANDYVLSTLKHNCNNSELYNIRAMILAYQGNVDLAKKLLKESLSFDPDNSANQKLLKNLNKLDSAKEEANKAFKNKNYEEAIKLYSKCLEIDENLDQFNSIILTNRAIAYSNIKKINDAINDLNKAIELNENYSKAYLKRGELKIEIKEFDEAIKDFESAKRIDPQIDINDKIRECRKEAKLASRKDYYKSLGVSKDASIEEIKKSYKKLALLHHPDKQIGKTDEEKKEAEKVFKEIAQAYQVLSNPEKRKRYDMGFDDEDPSGGFGGDFNPHDIFRAFFGGGNPFSSFGGGDDEGPFGSTGGTKFFFSKGGPSSFKFSFG